MADAVDAERLGALYRLEASRSLPPEHQAALDRLRAAGDLPTVQLAPDDPTFDHAEQQYGLPAGMLRAVVGVESSGRSDAVSPTGVTGLAQVTLATGAPYGLTALNRTNPYLDLDVSARHLADLLKASNGDVRGALAQYGDHNEAGYADKVLKRWPTAPPGPTLPAAQPGTAMAAEPPAAPVPAPSPQGVMIKYQPPPTGPGAVTGDVVGRELGGGPDPRAFFTRLPSIASATAGARAGMMLPGPWPVKAVGAIGGAALGGGGAEALQAWLEHQLGADLEPGKSVAERGQDAALTSGAAQALGGMVGGVGRYALGAVRPGLQAAAKLGPEFFDQALQIGKGGITHIRAADGTLRSLSQALDDPDFLAGLGGPHSTSLATLARAWWQRAASLGSDELASAWQALGKKTQATLFGQMREPIAEVVKTMAGGESASAMSQLRHSGLGFVLGGPKVAGATAFMDWLRNSVAPAGYRAAMTSPTFGPAAASLAGSDALPWAQGLGSAALQTGAAGLQQADAAARPRRR